MSDFSAMVESLHSGRLVQDLRSNRKMAQAQAAKALALLAEGASQEQCEEMAAAGAVPPLVRALRSGSAAIACNAAWALHHLSLNSSSVRADIAAAGAIPALVPLLSSGNAAGQQAAAAALASIAAAGDEHRAAVVAAGALPLLVQLCSSGSVQLCSAAATALSQVSRSSNCCAALAAVGGVAALAVAVSSGGGGGNDAASSARRHGAAALSDLAAAGADVQPVAAVPGAQATLVRMLLSRPDEKEANIASVVLGDLLAAGCPGICSAVVDAGGIDTLAQCLASSGSDNLRRFTAAAWLGNMAQGSPERSAAVLAAGCARHLVRLLGGGAGELAQEAAAGALMNLTCSGLPGAAAQVAAAGAVPALLALLAAGGSREALARTAHTIANLAAANQLSAEQADRAMPLLEPLFASGDGHLMGAAGSACHSLLRSRAAAAAPPPQGLSLSEKDSLAAALQDQRLISERMMGLLGILQHPALLPVKPREGEEESMAVEFNVDLSTMPEGVARQLHDYLVLGRLSVWPELGADTQQQQQRPPRVCAAPGCGATANLRRCGGCGAVRYCGEACSRAHWRAHKAECRRLQAERVAVHDSNDS